MPRPTGMKPLYSGSAIYSDGLVWTCKHGVGYPDICEHCPQVLDRPFFRRVLEALRNGLY